MCAKFIGRTVDIGIAKEASRGSAEASVDFYLPKTSLSLDDKIEQVIDESSLGVIEDSPNASVIATSAEFEIEGNILDKSFGLLALSAMGTVSTSGPSDSAYTHSYTVAQDAQHDSLTLFYDDGNQDYKHALAVVNELEIDIALGKYATYKASGRALAGATATLTPSYSAENHFLPQHGSVKIASALAGLTGASAINIRKVNLKLMNNVEDDRKLGSLAAVDFLNTKFSVEGSLELVFDDNAFKTLVLADTANAMRIRLTSDVLIGSSSVPQLTIDLAKCKFSEFTRNIGNDEIVTATVNFKAHYSLTDTSMITMELKNAQSSY